MPKETFYNLETNKRHKIVQAAIQEFTEHELHKSRVSNIIKMANIPRGSFYQYFEDIDDLYYHVIDSVFDDIFAEGYYHANETDDLFDYTRRTFEVDMKGFLDDKRHQFIKNVLKSIGSNHEYLTHHNVKRREYILSIMNKMNLQSYRIESEEEKIRMYEFLQTIKRSIIHQMMMKQMTDYDAKQVLNWHLDIVKNGLQPQGDNV